jgi:hypothetical protein
MTLDFLIHSLDSPSGGWFLHCHAAEHSRTQLDDRAYNPTQRPVHHLDALLALCQLGSFKKLTFEGKAGLQKNRITLFPANPF